MTWQVIRMQSVYDSACWHWWCGEQW